MLYAINQTTLVRWHKNSSRRDEIRLLMQGLSPPRPKFTTDPKSLPPVKTLESGPGPSPLNPHSFPEPEDATGRARLNKRKDTAGTPVGSTAAGPSGLSLGDGHSSLSSAGVSSGADSSSPTSRTTAWRRKREREEGQRPRERKKYTCRICGKPMTSPGHTQFYGQRYCPGAPGQLPQKEWLRMKREERRKQGPH